MEYKEQQAIIEAILYAAGRQVEITELMSALELSKDEIILLIDLMINEYKKNNRGIEIIKVNDAYQLCTIAYNPKITRAEIESIRGVNSDGSIYKLLEYELIKDVGKMDAPGRPTMYAVSDKFLKMFGISSLDELPKLPKYKLDENQQIVIDEYIETVEL